MNPMPGNCPVCHNTLSVTHLQCGQCGTGIEGSFALGRFQALTADQVSFLETFIKSKGKIKDVEAELGISYPTVVARLNEVVRAMGFDVEDSGDLGEMSDVDQYELYEAQVLKPQTGSPMHPMMPRPLMPPGNPMHPARPMAPTVPAPNVPAPGQPKLTAEQRQQILDDLAEGKISASEAMQRLNG